MTSRIRPIIRARLEELREELRAERISYGELAELQGLAEYIEAGDVELLEAAGVPEFDETGEDEGYDEAMDIGELPSVARSALGAGNDGRGRSRP